MADETLVLRPSKLKWVLVLLGSLVFTAGSVFLIVYGESDWRAYLGAVFFGLGVLVALVRLFAGTDSLEIGAEGFVVTHFGRRTAYAWKDCSPFSVVEVRNQKLLSFDPAGGGAMSEMNRKLTGFSSALPETYGMDADKLAALMNERRGRAVG